MHSQIDHFITASLAQHATRRTWSDDEDDDLQQQQQLQQQHRSNISLLESNSPRGGGDDDEHDSYLLSKELSTAPVAGGRIQHSVEQPQSSTATAAATADSSTDTPPAAVPIRLLCRLVPLPIESASPEYLHRQAYCVRSTFRTLRSAARIANRALDELRQSIIHVSSDESEEDENDQHPADVSSSRFNGQMWKSAVKMGGVVPPVAWLRSSCVVPATANSQPPPINLPVHCFLEVKCAVDARGGEELPQQQQQQQQQKKKEDLSLPQQGLLTAQLTALLCYIVSRFAFNNRNTANSFCEMRRIVSGCFKSVCWARGRNRSATSPLAAEQLFEPLLFLRPCLEHFISPTSTVPVNIDDEETDSFELALKLILEQQSQQVQKQQLVDFVSSALLALFCRSNRHNLRRNSLLERETTVGAFGVFFRVSDARVALRAFTLPIEKDLVSNSTSNTVPLDLLEAYVAAHLVRRSSQCNRETAASQQQQKQKGGRKLSAEAAAEEADDHEDALTAFPFLARIISFQKFQDSLQLLSGGTSRLLTVDLLVLASVIGNDANTIKGSNSAVVPCAEKIRLAASKNNSGDVHRTLLEIFSAADCTTSAGRNSGNGNIRRVVAERLRIEMQYGERVVPTSLRLRTWAALLGICTPAQLDSDRIADTDAAFRACACDRQVSLDLPRCHPSDPFTRSPAGQQAIHRVVRMWLRIARVREEEEQQQNDKKKEDQQKQQQQQQQQPPHHIHYWQGVDSMAATVLSAGKDEQLAAHCLARLVEVFVPGFATSGAIRARVGRISGLLRFHDPFAAAHLDEACGVQVDHFALPWILTAFAHVFPLSLTCRLWDALLLHADPISLLCNFTVAVITASRLQFLNAADLASSLLVLRHAANSVVLASAPVAVTTASDIHQPQQQQQQQQQQFSVSFETLIDTARRMTRCAPPYSPEWDDPAQENFIEQKLLSSPRMLWSAQQQMMNGFERVGGDDDDENGGRENNMFMGDDVGNHPLQLKRYIASVKLSEISCCCGGETLQRWSRVFLVIAAAAAATSSSPETSKLLDGQLVFVAATQRFRVKIDVSSVEEEEALEGTISQLRTVTKTSGGTPFIVAVVGEEGRNGALEAAALFASEGIEHVATVEI